MEKLTDNSPMPWGKHKGTAMANVPAHYLLWLVRLCLVIFNQVMRFFFNKQIRNAYYRKGWYWYNLPFYMNIGKYKLCIYAMDMDWDSMRIKIEKDCKIVKVIKQGIF